MCRACVNAPSSEARNGACLDSRTVCGRGRAGPRTRASASEHDPDRAVTATRPCAHYSAVGGERRERARARAGRRGRAGHRRPRRAVPAPRRVRRAGRARRRSRRSRPCAPLRPAAVVLDVGLPGMDGIEVCRRLRAEDDWTPVLFVTARDDEVDRVLGLELGADDYVTKPFSPRELVARVGPCCAAPGACRAASRRCAVGRGARSTRSTRRVTVGRRRGRADGHRVRPAGPPHAPSRPGVQPRAAAVGEVWGYDASAGTRTVDVHVAQVRAKLGAASPHPHRARRRLLGGAGAVTRLRGTSVPRDQAPGDAGPAHRAAGGRRRRDDRGRGWCPRHRAHEAGR